MAECLPHSVTKRHFDISGYYRTGRQYHQNLGIHKVHIAEMMVRGPLEPGSREASPWWPLGGPQFAVTVVFHTTEKRGLLGAGTPSSVLTPNQEDTLGIWTPAPEGHSLRNSCPSSQYPLIQICVVWVPREIEVGHFQDISLSLSQLAILSASVLQRQRSLLSKEDIHISCHQ